MQNESLTDRTMTAAAWRFGGMMTMYVVRLVVAVILARLLPPAVFGVVGTASFFVELATALIAAGFSSGIIQQKELTETHVRVGFTLSSLQGLFFGALFFLIAPWLASSFAMPELGAVVRLLALRPVLTGLGGASEAILSRSLEFRVLARIEIVSFLISHAGIGIWLAVLDYGVWALVWAGVTQAAIRTVTLYARVRHPIGLSADLERAKGLFSFGVAGVLSRSAGHLASQGDALLVARFLGAQAMGFYRRAQDLMQAPINPFSGVLRSVLFPAFSEIQTESERLRKAYQGSMSLTAIGSFPGLMFMAVMAPELVRGILGEAWEPAVPALRVLCFAGLLRSVYSLGNTLLRAKGVTTGRVTRDVLHAGAVALAALLGVRWGIQGVAYAVTSVSLIPYFLTALLVRRLIHFTWHDFFAAQAAGVSVAVLISGVAYLSAGRLRLMGMPDLTTLILALGACSLTALLLFVFVPRRFLGEAACWAVERLERRLAHRKIFPFRGFSGPV